MYFARRSIRGGFLLRRDQTGGRPIWTYRHMFWRLPLSPLYDMKTARNLLKDGGEYALTRQECWEDSAYLAYNIQASVRAYPRNKDTAIRIYKDLLRFLKEKSGTDISVRYPPTAVSNTFERLMFIAKYLQDPRHSISELPELLWVSQKTVSEDIKRLSGNHRYAGSLSSLTRWNGTGIPYTFRPPRILCS